MMAMMEGFLILQNYQKRMIWKELDGQASQTLVIIHWYNFRVIELLMKMILDLGDLVSIHMVPQVKMSHYLMNLKKSLLMRLGLVMGF